MRVVEEWAVTHGVSCEWLGPVLRRSDNDVDLAVLLVTESRSRAALIGQSQSQHEKRCDIYAHDAFV